MRGDISIWSGKVSRTISEFSQTRRVSLVGTFTDEQGRHIRIDLVGIMDVSHEVTTEIPISQPAMVPGGGFTPLDYDGTTEVK